MEEFIVKLVKSQLPIDCPESCFFACGAYIVAKHKDKIELIYKLPTPSYHNYGILQFKPFISDKCNDIYEIKLTFGFKLKVTAHVKLSTVVKNCLVYHGVTVEECPELQDVIFDAICDGIESSLH